MNLVFFYVFQNSLLEETLLNNDQKMIAVPIFSHDTVFRYSNVFKISFSFYSLVFFSKSYQAVHYSHFPRLTKTK